MRLPHPGLSCETQDPSGRTPWEIFESRVGPSGGMRNVFLKLLDRIKSSDRCEDDDGDIDTFFDALEPPTGSCGASSIQRQN